MTLMIFFAAANSVCAQDWKTNLDEALKEAAATRKNVLLVFSVPDACDTCISLDRNVLKSEEFLSHVTPNFVLTRIEFKSSPGYTLSAEAKAKNLLIVERYNKDGFFPLVVALTPTEKVLGKIGSYNGESASEYNTMISAFINN